MAKVRVLDVKTPFDLNRKMICEFRRHSISNHFVSIVDLVVMEDKVLGKGLYESAFFDGQSTIEMLFALLETEDICFDFDHFGGLRMEHDMSCHRKQCKTLLIPPANPISTHEMWGE